MGQLRIIRGTEWYGRLLKMHIYIDSVKVGHVDYNDYKDFILDDGKHDLFVKIDIIKSRTQIVDLTSSRPSIFRIALPPVSGAWNLLLAVFDGKNQIAFEPQSTDTRANKF